jgi:hypothetical protein
MVSASTLLPVMAGMLTKGDGNAEVHDGNERVLDLFAVEVFADGGANAVPAQAGRYDGWRPGRRRRICA